MGRAQFFFTLLVYILAAIVVGLDMVHWRP